MFKNILTFGIAVCIAAAALFGVAAMEPVEEPTGAVALCDFDFGENSL